MTMRMTVILQLILFLVFELVPAEPALSGQPICPYRRAIVINEIAVFISFVDIVTSVVLTATLIDGKKYLVILPRRACVTAPFL